MSEDDVIKLVAQRENENTKKKFMYDLDILLKFLREVRKEKKELEKIPPDELMYISVSSLLQLERRKVNNMSRLL